MPDQMAMGRIGVPNNSTSPFTVFGLPTRRQQIGL